MQSGERDYKAAVAALNSLQNNFSAVQAFKKLGPGRNKYAVPEMIERVRRIGYEVDMALGLSTPDVHVC